MVVKAVCLADSLEEGIRHFLVVFDQNLGDIEVQIE